MITRHILQMTAAQLLALLFLSSTGDGAVAAIKAAAPVAREATTPATFSGSESYPEARDIFEAVSKQKLVADQRIQNAELLSVYDATGDELRHRESAPAEVAGAHAPQALKGNSRSMMIWGPYVNVPEGHYLVVYRFQVAALQNPVGTLFLDVAHKACTRSGVRLPAAAQPVGKWQEIAVPVHASQPMKLEFRYWPGGNESVVDRIYVFKVNPDPQALKNVDENLPLGEPVIGRADVVTSPYTDDTGMIDISGLTTHSRIRCPYTGHYFLVP